MGFFSELFQPIEAILQAVLGLLYDFTDIFGIGSYGLAIILLTILIKQAKLMVWLL